MSSVLGFLPRPSRRCDIYMLRASTPPAVVAADHRTLDHGSHEAALAAMVKRPVVCGGHGRSLCSVQRTSLNQPPTRCQWSGCAGGSGVVLQLLQMASSITWIGSSMSTPRWDLQVCRHPSHERSHRIPHSRLSGIACQVGGSLQKLLHESIGSIWRHFH